MANKLVKAHSLQFPSRPIVTSYAAVVGRKEGEGPLGNCFDEVIEDALIGEETWECAERRMVEKAINLALGKAGFSEQQMDFMIGGDLLNQIISASFAARSLRIPFFGVYGACSTMSESLCLGAVLIDGGYSDNLVCATSSHFATAERQYRYPLEMGNQRPLSAQWTVTGAGATILSAQGEGPFISGATVGKVVDFGIIDANNMGAAMAPAAADTLSEHFKDFNRKPDYYDKIVTGDLGEVGSKLLYELMDQEGYDIRDRHMDCGCVMFTSSQDVHSGGSGCGCSASVLNGVLLKQLQAGEFTRILFMATGALLSSITSLQGESIPGIAHAVVIESNGGGGA